MRNSAEHWEVTAIGCPECAGVLSVRDDGKHRHREYRCHVGHRFSLRSLLQLKEIQLERLLWSALSVMDHVACVCEIGSGGLTRRRPGPGPVMRRVKQLRRQKQAIRSMIEETCVCDMGDL